MNDFFTVKEAAKLLHVSESTIRHWIWSTGELKAFSITVNLPESRCFYGLKMLISKQAIMDFVKKRTL